MATRKNKKEVVTTHAGYIAIIGRPNVGKSTLLNSFLGKKLSITSRKPQTTRHRILGVTTTENTQMIFVDTPGLHLDENKIMNKHLNKTALSTLGDVDCVLWLLDATRWNSDDDWVAEKLNHCRTPILLVINKVDKLEDSDDIIPLVEKMSQKIPNLVIIPISAKKKFNLDRLKQLIESYLPVGPFYFGAEQSTDRPESFVAAEFIREKLVRFLGDELPYATMVSIKDFKRDGRLLRIDAEIWVEKESQKGIVIGRNGDMLKKIGEKSRLAMEKYFDQKIFLRTWVKVKESWSENEQILRETLM
jgi:GTP-binding protein Era